MQVNAYRDAPKRNAHSTKELDRGPDTIPTDYGALAPPQAAHAASEIVEDNQRTKRMLRAAAGGQFVLRFAVGLLVCLGALNLLARCSA